jgi:hypothetical protein
MLNEEDCIVDYKCMFLSLIVASEKTIEAIVHININDKIGRKCFIPGQLQGDEHQLSVAFRDINKAAVVLIIHSSSHLFVKISTWAFSSSIPVRLRSPFVASPHREKMRSIGDVVAGAARWDRTSSARGRISLNT